jgi:hypothetical protein
MLLLWAFESANRIQGIARNATNSYGPFATFATIVWNGISMSHRTSTLRIDDEHLIDTTPTSAISDALVHQPSLEPLNSRPSKAFMSGTFVGIEMAAGHDD